MLQQTFFLLLNVPFPPFFLSPLLVLSLSLFFRGARAGNAPACIRAWVYYHARDDALRIFMIPVQWVFDMEICSGLT